MPKGRLGVAMTITDNWVEVCKASAECQFASAVVHITNGDIADAVVQLALSFNDVPGAAELVESGLHLDASGGSMERGCFTLSPGERVFIKANSSAVSIRVDGLEQL